MITLQDVERIVKRYMFSNKVDAELLPSQALGSTIFFRATTSQSLANTSQSVITTYTEVTDFGNVFNPSTGYFTAPVSGVYHLDAVLTISNFSGRLMIWMTSNVTDLGRTLSTSSVGTWDPGANISTTVFLNEGDTVHLQGYQDSGGAKSFDSFSSFSGYLVGRATV